MGSPSYGASSHGYAAPAYSAPSSYAASDYSAPSSYAASDYEQKSTYAAPAYSAPSSYAPVRKSPFELDIKKNNGDLEAKIDSLIDALIKDKTNTQIIKRLKRKLQQQHDELLHRVHRLEFQINEENPF